MRKLTMIALGVSALSIAACQTNSRAQPDPAVAAQIQADAALSCDDLNTELVALDKFIAEASDEKSSATTAAVTNAVGRRAAVATAARTGLLNKVPLAGRLLVTAAEAKEKSDHGKAASLAGEIGEAKLRRERLAGYAANNACPPPAVEEVAMNTVE